MTLARQCPACGGTIATGTLCQTCLDTLARDLDQLADALDQLDTQLARQARAGNQGGTARSAIRPLPFDLPASDVHDLVRSVLVGWTRDLWESGHRNAPRTRHNGPYSHETPGLAPGATPATSKPTGRPQL